MKKAKYLIMMGIISAVDIFTDETSYMITNVNSTNVLEANSGEIADQWYDFGGIECRWYLKPAGDGSYYLINRMNEKRVVAVGTEDGTQVALEEPKDSAAERWFIGDGSYTFCNAENKMYLSIEHDGDGNGNVAVQNKEKTASSTWTIEESHYQGEPEQPEIAEALVAAGADIALYPAEQNIYYIPEEREFYSPDALGVEGFGGTVELPTTALAAANVERDREHAMYPDTNVMAHEFGHAFHLIGIKTAAPALFDEIDATYEKVVLQEGKWANSYAGSNRDEYFGQLAALWFNGQAETQTWNGVLGPVNTRDELKEYDPESYALLEKIFPADKYFASPWAKEDTVDNFDINGNPRN